MGPDLQPDVSVSEILLYAFLNPATIAAAFLLGRKADQPAKLLIAAFGGAVAGVVLLYIATSLRVFDAPTLARAAGGIFAASYVASLIYAYAGMKLKS